MRPTTVVKLAGTLTFAGCLAVGVFLLGWTPWTTGLVCLIAITSYIEGRASKLAEEVEKEPSPVSPR